MQCYPNLNGGRTVLVMPHIYYLETLVISRLLELKVKVNSASKFFLKRVLIQFTSSKMIWMKIGSKFSSWLCHQTGHAFWLSQCCSDVRTRQNYTESIQTCFLSIQIDKYEKEIIAMIISFFITIASYYGLIVFF